jgi:tRNA dimethylallyltransferase
MTSHVVVIVGATATGKSDLALDVAERLDAVIVNADAMQLYRGMDIGTAKLPESERRGIPHLMIDMLAVTEEASVAVYQEQARAFIDQHLAEDRSVVVVGGSGLYITALLDSLEFPGTDPAVRERLTREAEELGGAAMYERLKQLDPLAAAAILPGNTRRVVRALEVIEITGQPFTATLPKAGESYYPQARQFGIARSTGDLEKRIAQRTKLMWEQGLIDEVKRLDAQGLREGRTARAALGYAQALAQIDGMLTESQAIEATTVATRKFAKRQRTWFKRDQRITWLDAPDAAAVVAATVSPFKV